MSLQAEFEQSGSRLFRYRGFLPMAAAPIVGSGLTSFHYIQNSHFYTELWNVFCLLVSLPGIALRMFTIGYVPSGTSDRNTRNQVAIVPNLKLWRAPTLPFSWRTVLRREYTGVFLVTTIFPALEIAGDSIAEGHLVIDWAWVGLCVFGAMVYLTLRTLKRKSRLLFEAGR